MAGGSTVPKEIENPAQDWLSDRAWFEILRLPVLVSLWMNFVFNRFSLPYDNIMRVTTSSFFTFVVDINTTQYVHTDVQSRSSD